MAMQEHVESLRTKHARLEQLIDEEQHRPLPDQAMLARLKKEKLRIKEAIERSHPVLVAVAAAKGSTRIH